MASAKSAAATVDDMHRDLRALRDDMAQLTTHVAKLLSASGEEAVGEVKNRMRRMRDDIDDAVSAASGRSREAMSDMSEHIGEALEGSVREHPFATVAIAVGLGLLFGTVLHR